MDRRAAIVWRVASGLVAGTLAFLSIASVRVEINPLASLVPVQLSAEACFIALIVWVIAHWLVLPQLAPAVPRPGRSPGRAVRIALVLFLVILAAAVVYHFRVVLQSGFFWDDHMNHIQPAKIMVESRSPQTIGAYFFQHTGPRMFRQIPVYMSAIDYAIWRLEPAGWHFTTLFAHALASVCVALFAWSLLRSLIFACGAGALFASFPFGAEPVTYVALREETATILFYACALMAYVRFRGLREDAGSQVGATRGWYAAAFVSTFLALFSKEIAVTLPAMITLYDLVLTTSTIRKRGIRLAPFWGLLLFNAGMRLYCLGEIMGGLVPLSSNEGETATSYTLTGYLMPSREMIHSLFVSYPKVLFLAPLHQGVADDRLRLGFAAAAAIIIFCLLLRRWLDRRLILFFIAAIFLIVIPVISYFPSEDNLREATAKRFYLSGVIYAPMLAYVLVGDFAWRWLMPFRIVVLALAVAFQTRWGHQYSQPWIETGRNSRDYIERFQALERTPPPGSMLHGTVDTNYEFLWRVREHYQTISGDADYYRMAKAERNLMVMTPDGEAPVTPPEELSLGESDFVYRWDAAERQLTDLTEQLAEALEARIPTERSVPVTLEPGRWSIRESESEVLLGTPGPDGHASTSWRTYLRGPELDPQSGHAIWTSDTLWVELAATPIREDGSRCGAEHQWVGELWWNRAPDWDAPVPRIRFDLLADGGQQIYRLAVRSSMEWALAGSIDRLNLLLRGVEEPSGCELEIIFGGVEGR